ncbi:MAG TPA: xanthine dehydrogenase family protein molybdopterin-binding subunit [Candidatus Acidoferrum sp.]|nr:xanthine dehydrogenase family protein molybdopterin-binding subunit [Candidatus Acidoferrum sp.]
MGTVLGKSVTRLDAWDKVTGKAIYTDDMPVAGVLCARLLTSTCAHGRISRIDTYKARALPGVKTVLTGDEFAGLFGPLLLDRPALARGVVRYAGEPVAMAVAIDEATAEAAVRLIDIEYEPMPAVLTPSASLAREAPLIHENLDRYKKSMADVYPEAGTNIASRYAIRKGDAAGALAACAHVAKRRFALPPSGHLAMEVRTARAEVSADGAVTITTSSQAPFAVRKLLSDVFMIPAGQIQVKVPFVGGGFGGKAPAFAEMLALLASRAVGGKAVRLTIPREQDMAGAPCRQGLEAEITLGADKEGRLQAAVMEYRLDCGAYTDISPYLAKAIAVDCTGPYRIENVSCDALCVYTNHTYATSYRSFTHESSAFCVEGAMDSLARICKIDPLEFRLKNAIGVDDATPTGVYCTKSNTGDLAACLAQVKALSRWEGGKATEVKPGTVRTQGVSCFWKTENPPTDAVSGAFITFNSDGSVNLHTGVVEMGSASQSHLAQMLAERLGLPVSQVHVVHETDTRTAPEHWKTVASLTEYMAGRAVIRAADDAMEQLRATGALAFNCPPEDIEISGGRVFSKKNPEHFLAFKDIVMGYLSKDGLSLGEPALGRGRFMLKGLSLLDPATGRGKTGPAWTVGAQVVEVEADLANFTYRLITATTVMDVGRVISPEGMRAMVAGGMAMGLSMASREAYFYYADGVPQTPNLRTYKLMHIGQEPEYRVGFVETPQEDSPYGVRAYSEHGIIGIPAALANALSAAFGRECSTLPLTPEALWRQSMEGSL